MLRQIVSSSLRFRLLVVAAAAALMVVGATQLRKMPVDVLPEFGPPTVEIQTEALGLSAAEVEQLITVPMEQDLLNGVAFLDDIRSESVPGLSRIFLIFEPGTHLFQARQVVTERLTQAHALPNVSKPPQMLQPLSSTNRVMIIGASTKTLSPIELSVLARWTIVPRLVGVPGVANVSVWGFRDRQLQVQVDPKRLAEVGVTLEQVVETTGNSLWFSPLTFVEASTPGTGGFIETPNQRIGVQHLSPISNAADLAKVSVDDTGGRKLRLGDVASVVEDHQPLIGDALVNAGGGNGLLFVVQKLPGANTLDVTRGLEATIDAMRPGLAGVDFDTTVYRPASFIDTAIGNLTTALIIGAILVFLVLAAFLFRWRAVLIALVAIPLSVVAAALVLWALGTTMNAIVLAGLVAALALVIEDAISGVDGVARRLREHRPDDGEKSTAALVLEATGEGRRPSVYATLIIALAVLPVFFLEELAGSFFPDLAGAYLLALFASMVVALTVTPALSLLLLSRASFERRESPLARWLQGGYEQALGRVVRRPLGAYVVAGAVLAAAAAAMPFLGHSLLPTLKEEQLLIRWDGPPGTSLPEMNRITARASSELRSLPGVREVGAHVGRAVTSDLSVAANSAEIWVSIDRSADYDATAASIGNVIHGYPGLSATIGSFSNERAAEVLARQDKDVVVRVYGEESAVLRGQAERVRQAMLQVDGIADASVELPAVVPTFEVEVDLAAARAHGVKPGDVRRASTTLLGGITVGSLFERQKVFDVVVWGTPETRSSLTSIRKLLLDTPGGHVRLDEVADVRIAPNPSVIERQAVSRYLDVGANVNGRDRGAAVQDIERRLDEFQFPLEYHAEVLGAGGQPLGRLIGLAIAAALGMFLLLQACFGSWRLATLSFLTLPLAVTGGVLAALAAGGTLSFGSLIGLAAVLGLAARSGVLLIARFRHLEHEEGETFGPGLVLRGSRERLVPTVMTAAATALTMLPVVILGVDPGYELIHPLAVVVLGGVVTSTLLILFVVPPVYLRLGPSAEPEPSGSLVAALHRRAQLWARRRGAEAEMPVRTESST